MINVRGMEYHEFSTTLGSGRVTIYLLRIDPSMNKFVVGSLSNDTDKNNHDSSSIYKKNIVIDWIK